MWHCNVIRKEITYWQRAFPPFWEWERRITPLEMLYLSEFTFPWADILLRKKDIPATAQQKGHFFLLYWPKVVMGLWNKFHLEWSGQHFSSYRGNLVWALCCAEFEYVDLKIGLLVHIPVSEVFLLTAEVCWHGNSLNLALNAVSLAPGLPGLRTLLIERLSQGFLSAEDDALSRRWSWPMVFFSPKCIKPLRNFAF